MAPNGGQTLPKTLPKWSRINAKIGPELKSQNILISERIFIDFSLKILTKNE